LQPEFDKTWYQVRKIQEHIETLVGNIYELGATWVRSSYELGEK
jgi:hypothetical protein